ncbi:bifunctional hydroxymethylpyrimidine kinase/phosphomethylpyrimidine kinase [Peptococcus simiae]|uniref:Hydroxymethylpyrimidine/phosphomethylpyrimidine kinase n=1 Tax=Peptococcus simiae TaxID=1643805 RepID=A0ABW9GYC6_9FIRM
MKRVLTIAGSDSSGGAGLQADLKTFAAYGLYGMSVITALTAQNTTGVQDVLDTPPDFVAAQMASVFEDIRPDAVKIGMLSSPVIVEVIAENLKKYGAENIVLDPVMGATSGSSLIKSEAVEAMEEALFPLATVITPNLKEAEVLAKRPLPDKDAMVEAAREIGQAFPCAVLIKRAEGAADADDYLFHDGQGQWICGDRIPNPNTHGTGCTLSSAIAAGLALGYDLDKAVHEAKAYIDGAIRAGLDLGQGRGPLHHGYRQFPLNQ